MILTLKQLQMLRLQPYGFAFNKLLNLSRHSAA